MKTRILLLNQSFYPDVVSTAQHLSDLARSLVRSGAEVTVVCSRRGYDTPEKIFPAAENWEGISIVRVPSTGFGKGAKWRRAVDFASFLVCAALRMIFMRRFDVVVALTSPPIVSSFGAAFARFWRTRFVYWVMDLNPDEAVAANWLKPRSLVTKFLEYCSQFSLRRAEHIVVLDHFMAERVAAKGIPERKICIIPPWSHDDAVSFDIEARDEFRKAHSIEHDFVVMYAGNHSPCHPLDTLLDAARAFKNRPGICFCFVGGGSEHGKIAKIAADEHLRNILCLPYQPLDRLSALLSAADLHVAVMGDPFVGMIHPCKVYNILQVGAPLLYIGPEQSHIAEILAALASMDYAASVRRGDSEAAVRFIERIMAGSGRPQYNGVSSRYSSGELLPKLQNVVLGGRDKDEAERGGGRGPMYW